MKLLLFNSGSKIVKTIYLIFLILVIFILCDRSGYIIYRNISSSFYNLPSDNSINMKISKNEKVFYNTLIMGSSRTKKSIYPWYLNKHLGLKAKKIADPGKYPRYNYRYYSIFKNKYKTPEFLIYGIDYFIFKNKSNLTRMRRLLGFKTKRKFVRNFKINLELFNPFTNPSLIIRDKIKINDFLIDYLDHFSKKHTISKGISLISENRGSKRTAPPENINEPPIWNKIEYTRFPGHEGEFLLRLFNELEKDNVKVFVVIIPDIIGVYKTSFEREIFEEEIRLICKKYSNITILNYNSPDKFDLSDPKLFRDGFYGEKLSHMSYYGAEKFSKLLCDDIEKLTGILK